MAHQSYYPFDSAIGHVVQPVTLATTQHVISHFVDNIEELAIIMLQAAGNSSMGLDNALVFERMGITIHKILKDLVYLWRAHDILVQLAGTITIELVDRF